MLTRWGPLAFPRLATGTRISAAGIRATHDLLGPEFTLDLLFYADDLESLGLILRTHRETP